MNFFNILEGHRVKGKKKMDLVNIRRKQPLQVGTKGKGPVMYWMSRDQRTRDNWALLAAQKEAEKNKKGLCVVFVLVLDFPSATWPQYEFMISGLKEVEKELIGKRIPFHFLVGNPPEAIEKFIHDHGIGMLFADFSPLRIKRRWIDDLLENISIPFYQVDAHNIVPCWVASNKKEYAARTIRPKINRLLPEFLEPFPDLKEQEQRPWDQPENKWDALKSTVKNKQNGRILNTWHSGETAALKALHAFIQEKLKRYATQSNDPTKDAISNLSPYIHFGQLSSQRIALEVQRSSSFGQSKDDFLEQLIIRKELTDNYCYYNQKYDTLEEIPNWARTTLEIHSKDKREYIYSLEEFERGATHDDLWNAAQMEMVKKAKMHNYMRMYWAKKILEWTETPEEAMKIVIYLNDKYELDGRDPNGYVGAAWSIGGVHDRAWKERPIFGKIRYMNYNGCKSKFDVKHYIDMVKNLP